MLLNFGVNKLEFQKKNKLKDIDFFIGTLKEC